MSSAVMTRVPDWQLRFWEVVTSARSKPFEWGIHDCVTFAMSCVVAVTADAAIPAMVKDAFGEWTDAQSAIGAHRGDLSGAVTSLLGEPVRWVLLQIGDVALVIDDDGRELVAVHDGAQLICPDSVGLRTIPWRCALHGWPIGRPVML
jgi:hypothetical protein